MAAELETLEVRTRLQWRAWLTRHHTSSPGVWLVRHKAHTGTTSISYEDLVREAFCFGWIDSLIKRHDDDRFPLEGDREPRPYVRKPANEFRAAVSPDGRWLAYNSDESGRTEGYVQSFPIPGPRYQVTTDGTGIFGWKADGTKLSLGATPNRVVRVVDVLPGEAFRTGLPRAWGKVPELAFGGDIDREWTRTIVIVAAGKQAKSTIRIVLDWPAKIARR